MGINNMDSSISYSFLFFNQMQNPCCSLLRSTCIAVPGFIKVAYSYCTIEVEFYRLNHRLYKRGCRRNWEERKSSKECDQFIHMKTKLRKGEGFAQCCKATLGYRSLRMDFCASSISGKQYLTCTQTSISFFCL